MTKISDNLLQTKYIVSLNLKSKIWLKFTLCLSQYQSSGWFSLQTWNEDRIKSGLSFLIPNLNASSRLNSITFLCQYFNWVRSKFECILFRFSRLLRLSCCAFKVGTKYTCGHTVLSTMKGKFVVNTKNTVDLLTFARYVWNKSEL